MFLSLQGIRYITLSDVVLHVLMFQFWLNTNSVRVFSSVLIRANVRETIKLVEKHPTLFLK